MRYKIIMMMTLVSLLQSSIVFSQQKKAKAPAVPGVAVLNFSNNSGEQSLKHFSVIIPETISASLANVQGIRVVERSNLGKVVNEIELQQTGLIEGDTGKVARLAKADILIVGSISGTENNIIVTIKAIEVSSGKILDGKVLKGSGAKVIDLASSASLSMGAILSGKNIGYINVSTNPDNCDIFIDGISVGKSPLVDYKVSAGEHRIVAVKENYIDADTNINVPSGEHERWAPSLADKKKLDRMQMGIGVYGFSPFTKKVQTGIIISPYIGQSYEHLYIGAALGLGSTRHDQDIDTAWGGYIS